jgi:hypothetical protein
MPTLAQAVQCDFSLFSSMVMVDDHAQGCCPSEDNTSSISTDCICCDCGFQASSSQSLPSAVSVSAQKLQELSELSLVVIVQDDVSIDYTPVTFTPQRRASTIPVYLKNSVFLN